MIVNYFHVQNYLNLKYRLIRYWPNVDNWSKFGYVIQDKNINSYQVFSYGY